MGEYSNVHVEERKKQVTSSGRLLNNLLLIGAFDTLENNPQLFTSLEDAQKALGTEIGRAHV